MNVAMLLDNEFVLDRRVHREAKALTDAGFDLTLYAVRRHDLQDNEVKDGITVKRIFNRALFDVKQPGYMKMMAEKIASTKPDVVHCHDWRMLHVGVLIKKLLPQTKLIYDSHELFHSWPLHYNSLRPDIVIKSWLVRQLEIKREKSDARFIDHLITVSSSIATHLQQRFKLRNEPTLVRNLAESEHITEHKDFVRDALNIPASTRIVVLFAYKIYRKKRHIEAAISDLANKPNIALVIFCHDGGHKAYFEEWLKSHTVHNVFFHPFIGSDKIVNYLASCDVGLIPTWNKKHLSYWYGLENKLFHYVMSGLPVLATAQPEHKLIVDTYDIGVCVDGDKASSYYEGLVAILNDYDRFKANVETARKTLCWENERQTLIDLYDRIAQAVAANELSSTQTYFTKP